MAPASLGIVTTGSACRSFAVMPHRYCFLRPARSKPAGDDQWWELIDQGSSRPYYYNATTRKTVWNRPTSGDIVSLARLQEAQKAMMNGSGPAPEQQQSQPQAQPRASQSQPQHQLPQQTQPQQTAPQQQPVRTQSQSQPQPQARPESGAPSLQASTTSPSAPAAPGPAPNLTAPMGPGATVSAAPAVPRGNYDEVASSTPHLHELKDDLATHKRGFFRRKVSLHNMLSWSRECIPRPMLLNLGKEHRKTALEIFKLVQQFMGDRSAKGKTPESLALEVVDACWEVVRLRDELFLQLCKQTTENNKLASCEKGWQLLIVVLNFFPPTKMFESYLRGYIARHTEMGAGTIGSLAEQAFRRLDRIAAQGRRQGQQAPNQDEVANAIQRVTNPSVYGSTLAEIMDMQEISHPDLPIPLVVRELCQAVLREGGARTEGIFRVPGDIDAVNALKLRMDKQQGVGELPDPHVPASAIKLWFRELAEPVIPAELYEECIASSNDTAASVAVVDKLPPVNRTLVLVITRFLQEIGQQENQAYTKMSHDNLAMVWAPNYLRCPSDDPMVIFNNTKKEMCFVRNLHCWTTPPPPAFIMSLSAEDRAVLAEAFQLHESSPGQLSAASFGEVVRIVGANPSEEEVLAHCGNKTTFTLDDVANYLATQKLHEDPVQTLRDAFAMFDPWRPLALSATARAQALMVVMPPVFSEGKGSIDATEFRTVMHNLGERFQMYEIEEMMRVPETTADGQIVYEGARRI
ncbi:uncharacterized protein MONBRDRAFT_25265 [Monosiga brevicollis MX1]|uniref:Uncharacterized protein n=1 Tax=Monosiga brevicollis TaxID=81824 RepID=A9UYW5_MONBE|nr:uncharacterized protein MONBRDRAFT_25265 [Monosiga brevicollis MX1]EDQ89677.1 predicted protein [Monosiga brevicollis MX1]|eukprot:XP_001745706.1 hypothetical protein [Monosiga brevicollis MX1]